MGTGRTALDPAQRPKVLTAACASCETEMCIRDSHDPLFFSFHERSQRFQSYLVDVERDSNMIALDEMIPRDGERFLLAGEPFKVEGFHEGVRIAWESNGPLTIDESNGSRCYRGTLPDEVV
uniref:Type III secretion system flagellar brake protein YcgR PilZN domain-containing protein n=1 Tax=Pseudomonas putida TaxID=303 RepID=E0D4B1_PSEPU|nr:conserved hypothetical protein [Pseudomonas putida]